MKIKAMGITEKIILLIFIVSYLYFTIYTRNRIKDSTYLDEHQKKTHIILIWIIPYLWGILLLKIIKPEKYKTITKKDRKTEQNNFYESRKGFHGGG